MITKLEYLIKAAKEHGKKRLVAVYANDIHTISAIDSAVKHDVVEATLIGNRDVIIDVCKTNNIDHTHFNIVNAKDAVQSAKAATKMIREKGADILMKGSCSTDIYMRAILSKEEGLVGFKSVISHIAILEIPTYHKLLVVTDVAVIPAPTLNEKVMLTKYAISVCKSMGIELPKIALIAPTEQVLPKIQSCVDAALIAKMADRGQISGAIIDGPLAVDVAIDKEAAELKGLHSPIDADADALIFPSIESANAFFKCATKLCKAELAGVVVGASAPCVLTSRGDSEQTKIYSIALAVLQCK